MILWQCFEFIFAEKDEEFDHLNLGIGPVFGDEIDRNLLLQAIFQAQSGPAVISSPGEIES